jgi:DNA polymerase III subunit alpha
MADTFSPSQYSGPTEFVHLHNHTVFSALDGVATPEQYAQLCFERGYPAMSATEHGHMASVPDMYLAFKKWGVKYIPGCEIYFNDWEPERQKLTQLGAKIRSPEWRKNNPDLAARISRNRHLTILCKNEIGYHNLLKLTTQAYDTGLFGMGRTQYNRIWFDKLCEYKEGLIILSGCLNGPICHELRYRHLKDKEGNIVLERTKQQALESAVKYIKLFKSIFKDDYYIELQMPGIEAIDKWGDPVVSDQSVFRWSVALADKYNIPVVLTNDCHYLNRKDFELQKLMMAVAQETTMDSPDLFHVNSSEQFVQSRAELWSRFKNNGYSQGIEDSIFEQMCDNTLLIADKCVTLDIDTSPKIPEIKNADTEICKIVRKRIKDGGYDKITKRFLIDGKEVTYVEQANIELNRFIDKGFSSYFLITRDLVNYGRERGWPFSPRGSAGGSLVCYLMGIHTLDPMLWGLSFDRFLSPSRGGYMLNINMPDPIN